MSATGVYKKRRAAHRAAQQNKFLILSDLAPPLGLEPKTP